jgi:hypothetical protein
LGKLRDGRIIPYFTLENDIIDREDLSSNEKIVYIITDILYHVSVMPPLPRRNISYKICRSGFKDVTPTETKSIILLILRGILW